MGSRNIFNKGKDKVKKIVKKEAIQEVKATCKRHLPLALKAAAVGLAVLSMVVTFGKGSPIQASPTTVNNYYVYNGPVYRA